MSTSLITDIMLDASRGAAAFSMAETFASSQLVPRHLQGKPADCFIALTMAAELRQNPLMVMQNIVIVQGTAGWKAQYTIAMANASGLFRDRIDWTVERLGGRTDYKRKTKDGPVAASMENMRVTAFATLAGTGARVEFSCDTTMAIAEGWADNAKYTSMPEVMLRYRSAAFLVRFYAPDVLLGMYTDAELETIPAVEVAQVQRAPAVSQPKSLAARIGLTVIDGQFEPATEAEPVPVVRSPVLSAGQRKALDALPLVGMSQTQAEEIVGAPAHEWDRAMLTTLSKHVQTLRGAVSGAGDNGSDDEAGI